MRSVRSVPGEELPRSRSRYEALFPIGTGGMATVFLGYPRTPDGPGRLVALKRAHPHVRADAALAASMKQEAWLASRLDHPNVVRVLDVEETADELILVLDYVEGCTLRTLLSKLDKLGEHCPREIVRIILDTAAGLHAAHHTTDEDGRHLGLVHRDVSPSNILVGLDGISRISDFGIAKAFLEPHARAERTETGVLKGKSSYMAPEYVMHQHAHAASDLFSLGVAAWESLTGARLFRGATEIETLERVIRADTRPLAEERPELAPLEPVFRRALARLPTERQPSVDVFARELEARGRAAGLVASHDEVRHLVERVIGHELAERRSALPDDVATLYVRRSGGPSAAGEAGTERGDPIEESATELFDAGAPAPESATEILETADPDEGLEPILEGATEPIRRTTRTSPTSSEAPRARSSAPPIPDRPKRRAPRGRPGRERRALALAFAVFALVLIAMAVQLWRSPHH